jgi:hypothetical protein
MWRGLILCSFFVELSNRILGLKTSILPFSIHEEEQTESKLYISIRGDYTGAGCLLENAIKRCTPHNNLLRK